MKLLCLLSLAVLLSSCNTMIGLGRDTKQGYQWSKKKIQERRQPAYQDPYGNQGYQDPYGAPVY